MVSRKGFVVYYQTAKIIPEIEKLGVHIVYRNDNRNYFIGYVDSPIFERVKKQIETMKAVKKFEESLVETGNYEFSE
jgi:uncharacterized protein YlbG (UPF0298 family)